MNTVFNASKDGVGTVLMDWQVVALRFFWVSDRGVTSREVWLHVNKELGEARTISRASVIQFLSDMVKDDVISEENRLGKGGCHEIYALKLDEEGYKRYVARIVISEFLEIGIEEIRARNFTQ